MNKYAYVGIGALLSGCLLVRAQTANTGHLFVSLTDRETGCPITNATVTVRCQTQFNIGYTLESHFTKTSAMSNSNGIAHVEFQFYDSDFSWRVDAPNHYNGIFGPGHGDEQFGCVVEESDYLNIDTNTVQGLAMYNELVQLDNNNDYLGFAAKFAPKSVTYTNNVICRSVCLTPRHNPQPMYAYGECRGVLLPKKRESVSTANGLEVTKYEPVGFDMKECLFVSNEPNYDPFIHGLSGSVPDFRVESFRFTTNDVVTTYGWIEFASGCGAYRRNTTGDPTFPTTYEADTNETFVSAIPFEYSSVSGQVVYVEKILKEDEYMVLRTRAATNEVGMVTSCNYSKILGPMSIQGGRMWFRSMIFNPRPNDSKLEFDKINNLATRDPCNWYP